MSRHSRRFVGGRAGSPSGQGRYPHGIEILLKKAKVDPQFRDKLLRDPVSAAHSIDLVLTDSEEIILANASRSTLSTMIQKAFVPRHQVSSFLTQKAPALVLLVLASTVALEASGTKGITVEDAPPAATVKQASEKMAIVQSALEAFKKDNGQYPSSNQWSSTVNPLDGYVSTPHLFDPWGRKLHYEGIVDESGQVGNYNLESLGWFEADLSDNIPCPVDPERHSFSSEQ